jgi:hypothetical protein
MHLSLETPSSFYYRDTWFLTRLISPSLFLSLFYLKSGLMVVLDTGNMTSYPDTCSKATASFSVLSETIKEIQTILRSSRKRTDLSNSIQQLQNLEKEKLHLTAAHHLERIRERANNQQLPGEEEGTAADARIQKLLQEGVASLRQKIHQTIEVINEVLDDVRCALLEEDDEE